MVEAAQGRVGRVEAVWGWQVGCLSQVIEAERRGRASHVLYTSEGEYNTCEGEGGGR